MYQWGNLRKSLSFCSYFHKMLFQSLVCYRSYYNIKVWTFKFRIETIVPYKLCPFLVCIKTLYTQIAVNKLFKINGIFVYYSIVSEVFISPIPCGQSIVCRIKTYTKITTCLAYILTWLIYMPV